ncbi:NADP-dependent oxidoreductase [Streptomyces sp. NPDC046977]|uniref:quinone oxidoreductase family protein n=1 Tax=Streptomyces sp. NPDC046977 TaxID=3154703 RepID=UPI0033F36B7C
MKAVGFRSFGPPDVLELLDLPDERPLPGQVRIRVRAAGLSAPDDAIRLGWFQPPGTTPDFPTVPGYEAAGVVEEAGEDTPFRAGDEVMAFTSPGVPGIGTFGAHAEYLVVPAAQVAPKPAGLDFDAAATLPMGGLTARMTLDLLGLSAGDTLVVTGAAGVVGGYIVQLAKTDGLTVVAHGLPGSADRLQALGADHVVERSDAMAEQVRALLPDGADGLADTAGLNAAAVAAVRDGGSMATLRYWNGDPDTGSARNPFGYAPRSPGRGIRLEATLVTNYAGENAKLRRIGRLAEDGALTPFLGSLFPFEQAEEATRLLISGTAQGRIVLTMPH